MPPIKIPPSIRIAALGAILKVIGRSSAIPIVPLKPGIAPSIIPNSVPEIIKRIICGSKSIFNISIFIFLPLTYFLKDYPAVYTTGLIIAFPFYISFFYKPNSLVILLTNSALFIISCLCSSDIPAKISLIFSLKSNGNENSSKIEWAFSSSKTVGSAVSFKV